MVPYSTCCYCLMFAFPLHACNIAQYFMVHQAPRSLESPEIWDCTLLGWPHFLIISPILGHYHTHEAIQGFFCSVFEHTSSHGRFIHQLKELPHVKPPFSESLPSRSLPLPFFYCSTVPWMHNSSGLGAFKVAKI